MNKPDYPHPAIAREGWLFVAGAGAVALIVTFMAPWASLVFWGVALLMLVLFRDPVRLGPDSELAVVSPADGRITAVEAAHDPYAGRPALRISLCTRLPDTHANRAPIDGVVQDVQYFPANEAVAIPASASAINRQHTVERNAMVIRSPHGHTITAVQLGKPYAGRILCYAKKGDTLHRGQRYGFIRFGSRVEVYLPPSVRPRVSLGDKVRATSTVLADLPATSDSNHA